MADIPPRADTTTAGEHPSSPTERDRTRGVGWIIIGATVALLAPLTGFLGGTIVGSSGGAGELDPLFLWLFVGMVIGGIGGVVAIMGALRWNRANHGSR
ncbi:MAG: hypothetical protein M3Q98_15740 [Actinomycetota bacterium]|nr:hypothetical protein [Actinomycetota bacterium]